MKLLGIAGPARSGKDTIGNYLKDTKHFVGLAYATPMKSMISTLLNVSVEWIEAEENKECPVPGLNYSPRELLQTLGTDWGRNILGEDFWVDIVWRQVTALIESDNRESIVITDVRIENEATRIRLAGGVICHVARPNCVQVNKHASEAGIKIQPTDFSVNNNGTFIHLYHQVDHLMDLYSSLLRLRR